MDTNTISVRNLGPITHVEIPLPEQGGVVVLEGTNGSGKSTAISAAHALTGGADVLPVRDGEAEGEVAGLGARLAVSRRRERRGTLTVDALQADIDPALLAEPGIKDPEAADLARARVLCALAKVKPDLSLLTSVLPEGVDVAKMVNDKVHRAGSMPELAAAFKQCVEASAREAELAAATTRSKAAAMAQALDGIDLKEPHDEDALAAATETSLRLLAKVEAEAKTGRAAHKAWSDQKAKLDGARAARGGSTIDEMRSGVDLTGTAVKAAEEAFAIAGKVQEERGAAVTEAAERLRVAQSALREADAERVARERELFACRNAKRSAEQALEQAVASERDLVALVEVVEKGEPSKGPSDAEIAAIREEATTCRKAQERGAVIRAALSKQAEAFEISSLAEREQDRAVRLREAALSVWPRVAELVDAVRPSGLFLRDGRIYLVTDDRGEELFAELSKGERDTIAMRAAIAAIGAGGLLPYRQEAWEGLDPAHRDEVARLATEARVVVLTAQCASGELRATQYVPS